MKKTIFWIAGLVVALVAVGIVVVGMGVGSEASTLHDALEAAVSQHQSKDQVTQKLNSLGLSIASANSGGEISAKGNKHSLLVYGTWLTVDVKFDPTDKANGYKLDRASEWF